MTGSSGRSGRNVVLAMHDASRTGAPLVGLEVVRALRSAGYRCHVILREGGPLVDDFRECADGIMLEPLRSPQMRRALRATGPPGVWLEERWATTILRRLRPDLVYVNSIVAASYVRPAVRLRRPVVLHLHEQDALLARFFERYRLAGSIGNESAGTVHLVACSSSLREELRSRYGARAVHLIHEPVDPIEVRRRAGAAAPQGSRVTRPGSERVVVGACGAVQPRKGADLWLRAAASMLAKDPKSARFVWIGGGQWLDRMRREVTDLGLDDDVEFAGESADPYPLMAGFDLMTVPSRSDPFPLVTMEAMALGKPVVAYDVGGLREQVGAAGLLVAPEDVEAFAAAVRRLVVDGQLRRRLGSAAADRVESRFGIDSFRRSVVELVDAVAGRPDA